MIDNSLKPCPFCGGFVEKKNGYTGLRMFHCIKCDAVISFLHHERDPAATACYNNRPKQEYREELIRCKDCKWYKKLDGLRDVCDLTFCTYVYGAEFVRKEWEYCSRGERKDEGR